VHIIVINDAWFPAISHNAAPQAAAHVATLSCCLSVAPVLAYSRRSISAIWSAIWSGNMRSRAARDQDRCAEASPAQSGRGPWGGPAGFQTPI